MSINTKELCKNIKHASKNCLFWTLESGIHYITNRHWAVKYEELPRDVLIVLFSIFAKFPTEGTTLERASGGERERELVSLVKIFDGTSQNTVTGSITNIILEWDKGEYRVIKTASEIIKLNNDYMSMVVKDDEPVKCGNKFQPVSFSNNQFILLPIRNDNKSNDATVLELLAG